MQRFGSVLVLAVLAACGGHPQPVLEHVDAPPRRSVRPAAIERLGTRGGPVDEDASARFLEVEVDRRRAETPQQPERPRRTVLVPEWGFGSDLRNYEYDYDVQTYRGVYAPGYGPLAYRRRFPLGSTLFGAGLGAIIGHQSGRRDRGAAIGAGIGYLLGR